MRKFKPHKGLLKRVTVTASGRVKHSRPGGRHRKSLHSSAQNRQLRKRRMAADVENPRLGRLLGVFVRREKPVKAAAGNEIVGGASGAGATATATAPTKKTASGGGDRGGAGKGRKTTKTTTKKES